MVATALFVVGVSAEKSSGDTHEKAKAAATEQGEGAESRESHTDESQEPESAGEASEGHTEAATGESEEQDETVLGVDIEATGFVVLAAGLSLGLALGVCRPTWGLLLAVVAGVMIGFASLDVREVFHQLDEDNGGLALLAGVVAALHLAVAGVALLMRHAAASRAPTAPA